MYISQSIKDEFNKPESTIGDYFNVMSPLGLRYNSPEHYSSAGFEKDITFNPWEQQDQSLFEGLAPEVVYDIKDSAVSEEHMLALIGRNKEYQKSSERIAQDPLYSQIGLSLVTGLVDPITLVPIAGALNKVNAAVKGANTFAQIGARAGVVGSVGAASAVASESLMDAQGLPAHYFNATAYGMVLGGGLSVLGDAVAHASRPSRVVESFKKDPLTEAMPATATKIVDDIKINKAGVYKVDPQEVTSTVDDLKGNVDGTLPTRNGIVPRVKEWIKTPFNFAASSERIVLASASNTLRTLSAYIATPFTSKNYVVPKNAAGVKASLSGWQQTALEEVRKIWSAEKDKGLRQNLEEFMDNVGSSLTAKAAQQKNIVYSHPVYKKSREALDEVINRTQTARKEVAAALKEKRFTKEEADAAIAKLDEDLARAQEFHNNVTDKVWAESRDTIVLNDAEKIVAEYYTSMLKAGKTLDVPEFKNISDFSLYSERRIDSEKVRAMGESEAKRMIRAAMMSDVRNQNKKPAVITRKVNEFYDYAINADAEREASNTLIGNISGNTGRLGKRKFNIDDSMILPMLQTSASQGIFRYNASMSGQLAMRQMFPELRGVEMNKTTEAFKKNISRKIEKKVLRELGGNNAQAQKEMEALSYMVDEILGNVNVQSHSGKLPWRAQRTLSSVATLQLGAGMGVYNLFEIPAVALATGFHKLFGTSLNKGFADVAKHIYTGKDSELTKHLVGVGRLMSTMHTSHMNRFTDSNLMFTRAGSEGVLQKATDALFKYTGMHLFQSMNEVHTAVRMAHLINDYAPGKYGDAKMNVLMRAGLDEETIFKLQDSMRKNGVFDKDGVVTKLEIDADLQEALDTAIVRGIDDAVIQAGSDNVPRWMLELGPMGKMMTQFWSFGFKARERLLIKGMNENPAGLAAATLASTGLAMTYFYAIEQAEIATGGKKWTDAEYDLSTEDGFINLLQKGLSYSGPMAYPSFMYGLANKAVVFGGGESLPGAGYADKDLGSFLLGPTYGNASALAELSVLMSQGNLNTPEAQAAAYQLSILKTVPILSNATEALIKE